MVKIKTKGIIIILLICQISLPSFPQAKRALIIGIGEQEDKKKKKINGDRDIPIIQNILLNSGFHDFRILKNKQATKERIVNAFRNLVMDCNLGDIVYIHFSGHGQQMSDIDNDEADGWDETWIPYDAYRSFCIKDKGNKHITDDEINNMLTLIRSKIGRPGRILVVVDACHSGTSTWEEGSTHITQRGVLDKFIIPVANKTHQSNRKPYKNDWITISACKDFQSNFEMQQLKVGKLTYALKTILKNNKKYDNKEIEKLLIEFMENNPNPRNIKQTPVITESRFNDLINEIIK